MLQAPLLCFCSVLRSASYRLSSANQSRVVARGSYHVVIAANTDVNIMVGRLDGNRELFQLEGDNAGRSIQRLSLRDVLSSFAARTAS